MSVTVISPLGPVAIPINDQFFSISQPMAPAPTCNNNFFSKILKSSFEIKWESPSQSYQKQVRVGELFLEVATEDGDLRVVARVGRCARRFRED